MSGGKANKAALALGAHTPFHEAASVVLKRRLGAVADTVERLQRASESSEVRPSDIHQVRVSVRRASAALGVFEGCVSSTRLIAKVRKRLRRLRRSTGTARTCDVGMSILAHDRSASRQEQGIDFDLLEGVLRRRREKSMRGVRRAIGRCSPDRLRRWGRKLAEAAVEASDPARPIPARLLEESARATLVDLLADIKRCGNMDLEQARSLHELRLSAKRLRYATEVFGPCFVAERLDEATNLLVHVQDRLGVVNDLSEMVTLINERTAKGETGRAYAPLLSMYSRRFAQARAEFVSWWRTAGEPGLMAAYHAIVTDGVGASADEEPGMWIRGGITPITPGVNRSEA